MKKLNINDYLEICPRTDCTLPRIEIKSDPLLEDFPILKEMDGCKQDPIFHAEGNVLVHTLLVLKSMVNTVDWHTLDDKEQTILFMSGVFHDLGKIRCTTEENGKIVTKKHSVIGARFARNFLWDLAMQGKEISKVTTKWEIREAVSNMVLMHMLPVHIFDKQDPLYSICGSSYILKNNLLNMLANADNTGRVCQNPQDSRDSMDAIALHKMFCEENKCLYGKKEFKSEEARFKYFFERKGHPDFDRYGKYKGTAILMCGIQGSGKSYIINKKYSSLPVVGFDETRQGMDMDFGEDEGAIARSVKEQCKVLLRDKKDFVFNATNTIKDIRSKWIRLFRDYGYRIVIHYVERPFVTTLKANSERENKVPEYAIAEKFINLDVPTELECHELILDVQC